VYARVPINIPVSTALQLRVPKVDELVTPELALVDPLLAATERRRLPEPDDTLGRLQNLGSLSNGGIPAAISEVDAVHFRTNAASNLPNLGDSAARVHRRHVRIPVIARFAAAALVVTVTIVAVVDVLSLGPPETRVPAALPAEQPTRTSSTSFASPGPQTTTAAHSKRPGQRLRPRAGKPDEPAAEQRRFAWAPVPESTAYRVEIYRGSDRVFGATTGRAHIAIPATWKSRGRAHRLGPGEYRWYVWPIVDGKRAATAIVQAKLTVS
jgi:hypothetical protein